MQDGNADVGQHEKDEQVGWHASGYPQGPTSSGLCIDEGLCKLGCTSDEAVHESQIGSVISTTVLFRNPWIDVHYFLLPFYTFESGWNTNHCRRIDHAGNFLTNQCYVVFCAVK